MGFNEDFYNQLDQFTSSPILFLGSGFSFRYLQTEKWEDLLKLFSDQINVPFEKYRSKANSNWPLVGSLLAADYHSHWFSDSAFEEMREKFKQEMISESSPIKVAIAEHFKEASQREISGEMLTELEILKQAKIDSIITTNYDLLSESIFPDFEVYKSQKELIFSSLQEVGEIYKIHGCCTEPNSIVLTSEDYEIFSKQNPYIAAKLLTIFLEHPTIFIGYSLRDENIRSILNSVLTCLDRSQINQISQRLFFVEYISDFEGEPQMEKYEIEIGDNIIPLTRIKAKSYAEIYTVLTKLHQKFPAGLLRKIKEHIYELVTTNDPSERMRVVDFDNNTDLDKVDVVIGVGLHNHKDDKSYDTYTRFDIADDILKDEFLLDAHELSSKTLPKICKANTWIPVCKFLSKIEDTTNIDKRIINASTRPIVDWKAGNSYSYMEKQLNESHNSISDILQANSVDKASVLIPLLSFDKISIDELKQFLIDNIDLRNKIGYTSHYMKLLCLYDRMKYGKIE